MYRGQQVAVSINLFFSQAQLGGQQFDDAALIRQIKGKFVQIPPLTASETFSRHTIQA